VFDGVTGLDTEGDEIVALETESGQRLEDDLFVSTIDPSLLVDDIDASLNYRSMVILGAHIEASERLFPPHASWGYFPNHYDFTRVTDYDFTPQSIPDGEYVLTVEFPCFLDDDLWSRSDEWFDDYLLSFLDDQDIEAEILASEARRAPRAYPLPVEEELEKFERINSRLSEYENMYNLGRVSTYEYIWIKDIVQQAYETVDEITAAVTH
jgi:UDP-galactopyranose mutase